ncbi:hypothetical protein CT0861_08979 [Colletotrichum tofieldiae]|uniref:Uncharacterized protein n=2 Tax=Colletotrichum spaethianum species complex TaxID=2707349 RepID=A0A161W4S8_9PEZI|nr:hypothetical protein CT0861_08979 [Colletotrichum tofieldiae]GJC77437.1 hypothetical protein ColLi_00275 [Colletotrichum liriopes]GKT82442.1 hypothetical protein Ct61P_00292 [Colletotrichum tofieldiae]
MPQYQPQTDTYKDPTSKSEAKQQMAEQAKQERTEHSKSGANTGKPQGMEYVARKEHAADVQHNH